MSLVPSSCRRVGAAALLLALAVPATLGAQARTQVTPFFTSFFALLPFGNDVDQGTGDIGDERLTNAPGVGIRAAVALSPRVGVEGQFAYIFTGRQVKYTGGGPAVGDFTSGHALMASGRVTLHPRRSNFRGILGFGYQRLGGPAWDEANFAGAALDRTNFGGIIGGGGRANLTPRFAIDLTVETYLHSGDPADVGKSAFQADIMVTLGIPIGLRR